MKNRLWLVLRFFGFPLRSDRSHLRVRRLVLEPRGPATDSFYRLSDFSVVVMVVYSEVAARRDRGVVAGILPEKIWPDTQVEGLETEALC